MFSTEPETWTFLCEKPYKSFPNVADFIISMHLAPFTKKDMAPSWNGASIFDSTIQVVQLDINTAINTLIQTRMIVGSTLHIPMWCITDNMTCLTLPVSIVRSLLAFTVHSTSHWHALDVNRPYTTLFFTGRSSLFARSACIIYNQFRTSVLRLTVSDNWHLGGNNSTILLLQFFQSLSDPASL